MMKDTDKTVNQSKLEVSTRNWRKGRENVCERITIGSAFTFDFIKSGRFSFKPIMQPLA